MSQNLPVVTIFADTVVRSDVGAGGWGALLCCAEHRRNVFGGVSVDRPEKADRLALMAALKGLSSLTHSSSVTVRSSSRYVVDGATKGLPMWPATSWKDASGAEVANADLWKVISSLSLKHKIKWALASEKEEGLSKAEALASQGVADELDSRRSPSGVAAPAPHEPAAGVVTEEPDMVDQIAAMEATALAQCQSLLRESLSVMCHGVPIDLIVAQEPEGLIARMHQACK